MEYRPKTELAGQSLVFYMADLTVYRVGCLKIKFALLVLKIQYQYFTFMFRNFALIFNIYY